MKHGASKSNENNRIESGDKATSASNSPKQHPSPTSQRLSQALRANLKRRKAGKGGEEKEQVSS